MGSRLQSCRDDLPTNSAAADPDLEEILDHVRAVTKWQGPKTPLKNKKAVKKLGCLSSSVPHATSSNRSSLWCTTQADFGEPSRNREVGKAPAIHSTVDYQATGEASRQSSVRFGCR